MRWLIFFQFSPEIQYFNFLAHQANIHDFVPSSFVQDKFVRALIVNSAYEVMFLPLIVCLSVSLSAG